MHLQHQHYWKLAITVGCFVSGLIVLLDPSKSIHAYLLGSATNFIWIWRF